MPLPAHSPVAERASLRLTSAQTGVSDVIEIYVFTAIALVAAGVMIGVLAVLSLGIRRDDRPGGFPADTDDRVVRSARRVIGAGARAPELAKR
jgi:hypothetical protein